MISRLNYLNRAGRRDLLTQTEQGTTILTMDMQQQMEAASSLMMYPHLKSTINDPTNYRNLNSHLTSLKAQKDPIHKMNSKPV